MAGGRGVAKFCQIQPCTNAKRATFVDFKNHIQGRFYQNIPT